MLKSTKPNKEQNKGKLLNSLKPELQQHISKLFDLQKQPSKYMYINILLNLFIFLVTLHHHYIMPDKWQIIRINRINLQLMNMYISQRSLSENRLIQKGREQSASIIPPDNQEGSTEEVQDSNQNVEFPKEEQNEFAKSIKNPFSFSPSKKDPSKEVCILEGHEKNEIKFICMCFDCPRRFQKGCAYCMLQFHAKHLDEMLEIDQFNKTFKNNFLKSNQLYTQSQILLQGLNKHPLEQFFIQMKSAILQKLQEMEDKIKHIYKSQISEALALDLLNIKKYNQQFSTYNNKRFEDMIKDQKHLDRLYILLNGECFEKYQISIDEVSNKLDTNQIQINENEILDIAKNLEEKAVQIISKAMEQSCKLDKKDEANSNIDNLVTFQCDLQQQSIKKQEEIGKSSIQSENQSPRQILSQQNTILKRSQSQHMGIPQQIMLSPKVMSNQNYPLGAFNSARQLSSKQNFIFLNK